MVQGPSAASARTVVELSWKNGLSALGQATLKAYRHTTSSVLQTVRELHSTLIGRATSVDALILDENAREAIQLQRQHLTHSCRDATHLLAMGMLNACLSQGFGSSLEPQLLLECLREANQAPATFAQTCRDSFFKKLQAKNCLSNFALLPARGLYTLLAALTAHALGQVAESAHKTLACSSLHHDGLPQIVQGLVALAKIMDPSSGSRDGSWEQSLLRHPALNELFSWSSALLPLLKTPQILWPSEASSSFKLVLARALAILRGLRFVLLLPFAVVGFFLFRTWERLLVNPIARFAVCKLIERTELLSKGRLLLAQQLHKDSPIPFNELGLSQYPPAPTDVLKCGLQPGELEQSLSQVLPTERAYDLILVLQDSKARLRATSLICSACSNLLSQNTSSREAPHTPPTPRTSQMPQCSPREQQCRQAFDRLLSPHLQHLSTQPAQMTSRAGIQECRDFLNKEPQESFADYRTLLDTLDNAYAQAKLKEFFEPFETEALEIFSQSGMPCTLYKSHLNNLRRRLVFGITHEPDLAMHYQPALDVVTACLEQGEKLGKQSASWEKLCECCAWDHQATLALQEIQKLVGMAIQFAERSPSPASPVATAHSDGHHNQTSLHHGGEVPTLPLRGCAEQQASPLSRSPEASISTEALDRISFDTLILNASREFAKHFLSGTTCSAPVRIHRIDSASTSSDPDWVALHQDLQAANTTLSTLCHVHDHPSTQSNPKTHAPTCQLLLNQLQRVEASLKRRADLDQQLLQTARFEWESLHWQLLTQLPKELSPHLEALRSLRSLLSEGRQNPMNLDVDKVSAELQSLGHLNVPDLQEIWRMSLDELQKMNLDDTTNTRRPQEGEISPPVIFESDLASSSFSQIAGPPPPLMPSPEELSYAELSRSRTPSPVEEPHSLFTLACNASLNTQLVTVIQALERNQPAWIARCSTSSDDTNTELMAWWNSCQSLMKCVDRALRMEEACSSSSSSLSSSWSDQSLELSDSGSSQGEDDAESPSALSLSSSSRNSSPSSSCTSFISPGSPAASCSSLSGSSSHAVLSSFANQQSPQTAQEWARLLRDPQLLPCLHGLRSTILASRCSLLQKLTVFMDAFRKNSDLKNLSLLKRMYDTRFQEACKKLKQDEAAGRP